jgi:DNA-binding NarL/FixJ family response regulator
MNKNLTPKEMQVLLLLTEGMLYKEIADQFNVTIDAVKKHARNTYAKLGVRNRTEAAIKMGLIPASI